MNVLDSVTVDTVRGKVLWSAPSRMRPDLIGREAGGRNGRYWTIRISGRVYSRSRIVFFATNSRWPKKYLDHRNRDSFDDRISNLREATQQQNIRNRAFGKKTKLLPIGIRKRTARRYQARIKTGNGVISLGNFSCLADASSAYQQARRKYFGEFA